MASIVLTAASAAVTSFGGTLGGQLGGALGIPGGSVLGSRLGRLAGGFVGNALFGETRLREREGPRLADLAVQTSTYGKMIPILYGTVRIAGNIIWSRPIDERVTTTTSSAGGGGGKGGGGRVTQSTTTYSYSVYIAIGICEGPVDEVLRIWADAKQLDLSQYSLRIYKGDEEQTPDSFMQSFEGADATPAYRGLAYVVIEDFALADYGNRIPNFTFEVKKKAQHADYNGEILENMIGGMVMIPGAGEFVYDTEVAYKVPGVPAGSGWAQQGEQIPLNMHNASGNANVLLSVKQLMATCPHVEWVNVVVSWFGNSLDVGACTLKPGVEYHLGAITQPDSWSVAGFTRSTARQITLIEGSPRYGGTPDDDSLLRIIAELKARGYKVMLTPMIFMDVDGKPWRGTMTGSAVNVSNFFTKTNGYNAFITHYANLAGDAVDAFAIGSELKGLTAVTDTPGHYPAVDRLVTLAGTVRGIVGGGVTLTYAADWSEYHHTDGGWYHMDPLWACGDIDVIGIDAYFPLTNAPQDGYSVQDAIDGWTSGEGYDFYFTDAERTATAPLDAPYAWKNIGWFWANEHTNPDSSVTDWVPESKPVWFTEYGYPSVDGATNQPNVFYDPATDGSAFPYFSKGRVDFRAQRVGLAATQAKWKDSPMVQRMFVWTWDARPYPYWPDLTNVWSDGPNWKTGHWVQGKLGISSLAAIVADLCARSGMSAEDYNVSAITDQVEGFVISGQQSIRAAIEQLQQGYFFDSAESDHVLTFIPRGGQPVATIAEDSLVPAGGARKGMLLAVTRQQEIELPRRVNVVYLNRLAAYQPATQYAERMVTQSLHAATVDLPVVFSDQAAKVIADVTLYASWVSRNRYRFALPMAYARLEPADVIEVAAGGVTHRMRITSTQLASPGCLRVEAVAEDESAYDFYTAPGDVPTGTAQAAPVAATTLALLDIPALPADALDAGILRLAASGQSGNWNGAAVYRSDDGGGSYARLLDLPTSAIMGLAATALPAGPTTVFDDASQVTVTVAGSGELSSVTELAVLNGANAALLGDEIIQFKIAALVEPGQYTLSGLLRGRMGTEWAVGVHAEGERFVLLNALLGRTTMPVQLLNLQRQYKGVSIGSTLTATASQDFTYTGVALKPYAPVHVTAARDGSGNLSITWVRRTRGGGEWHDYVDAPLNEAGEAYEVEILSGMSVVRTLTGLSAPAASYSAVQQTADFGSPQSNLSLRVYQLAALVGRGYATSATV